MRRKKNPTKTTPEQRRKSCRRSKRAPCPLFLDDFSEFYIEISSTDKVRKVNATPSCQL